MVRAYHLQQFGQATTVSDSRRHAADRHDHQQRQAAKRALKFPPVLFTGQQAALVAKGFATAATESRYRIHALAIMPDHTHLVMSRHRKHYKTIAGHLKSKATWQLQNAGEHPLAAHRAANGRIPTPWGRNEWCPFISERKHMRATIRYVERNPSRAGLKPQRWKLVVPWEN